MKIIILAAGKGQRLMPLTNNTPKPLLDLGNGRTLLEEQIGNIQKSGKIDEIVIVIGYLAEQIEAKMKYYLDMGIKIRTIYNPFYEISNNLLSMWMARNKMEADFMVTNGDNIFHHSVFEEFGKEKEDGIFLALGKKDKYDSDDMKVTLTNNLIAEVRKTIPPERTHAESPGLCLVRGDRARRQFIKGLDDLVRDQSNMNVFWLEVFNRLHENCISVTPWFFETEGKWQEVDVHIDVQKVQELIKIKI